MTVEPPPAAKNAASFHWALAAALCAALAAMIHFSPSASSGDPRLAAAYARAGDTFVRLSYLAAYASETNPLRQRFLEFAAGYYSLAADSSPASYPYGLSLALALNATGNRKEAAAALSRTIRRAPARERGRLRPLLLYLTTDHPHREWVGDAERLLGHRYAPGPAFLAEAYQRIGEPDLAEAQRRLMEREGMSILPTLLWVLGIWAAALACGMIGLAWAAVAVWRHGWGALTRGEDPGGPLWAWHVLLEALAIVVLLQVILAVLSFRFLPSSAWGRLTALAAITILSASGALAWVKIRPPRGTPFGWSLHRPWRQAAAGLAAAGAAVVPTLLIGRAAGAALGRPPLDEQSAAMVVSVLHGAPLPAIALLVCGVVPALEETVFRGVVFRGLAARSSFWPAAVVSALLFALLHMSPSDAVPLFLLGLLFAWLYHRHHSLFAPAVAHGVYNALNLVLLVLVYGT